MQRDDNLENRLNIFTLDGRCNLLAQRADATEKILERVVSTMPMLATYESVAKLETALQAKIDVVQETLDRRDERGFEFWMRTLVGPLIVGVILLLGTHFAR